MKLPYTGFAKKALKTAEKTAAALKHSYIGTEHILIGLIKEKNSVAGSVLKGNGVEESALLRLMDELISPNANTMVLDGGDYSPRALSILDSADDLAQRFDSDNIGTEHILIALLAEPECAACRLLATMNVNMKNLYNDILTAMGEDPASAGSEIFDHAFGSEGVMTPTLERYSRDLTAMAEFGELDPVIGRELEIKRLIQIISRRTKNNPCLVGEPGVGKTAIVEGLAERIVKGDVPASVVGKRVMTLDLSGMVAGSKYRGEFEERIKRVMSEVISAGDVILFIDEIHTVIGAGGAEGSMDASNILKPALSRGELQVIGATTIEEYRKYFEKDAALERRFQPVTVTEPSEEETIEILKGIRHLYEEHHEIKISDEAVVSAVSMSKRYITDRFLPDKAIDVMDEAGSRLRLANSVSVDNEELRRQEKELEEYDDKLLKLIKQALYDEAKALEEEHRKLLKKISEQKGKKKEKKKKLVLGADDIAAVVSEWTRIPLKKLTEEEGKRLSKLEDELHRRVIGQDEAVSAVARCVRRGRVGLKDPKRPVGSFLFLGPTGVGKTEVTKALAEAVFGDEQAMIRVDMSEYMESHSVSKMIGSPPGYVGYEEGGGLAEKVRKNPYSVILFDEIEKAHPDVFNMLLQVLDDGRITDSKGHVVDFKNTIIIMTSNAGAKQIVTPRHLGFAADKSEEADYEKMKSAVMEEVSRIFKPEFLNRIEETIVFRMLNKDDMKKIVTILTKQLCDRIKESMDITLTVSDTVKENIVEKAYDPKYGARPLRRAITVRMEDPLSEAILKKQIKKGDKVKAVLKDKEIAFERK